jgi:hypothetical protein
MVPPAQSRVPELDETSPSAVTIRANLQPVTTVAMQQIKSVLVINARFMGVSLYSYWFSIVVLLDTAIGIR